MSNISRKVHFYFQFYWKKIIWLQHQLDVLAKCQSLPRCVSLPVSLSHPIPPPLSLSFPSPHFPSLLFLFLLFFPFIPSIFQCSVPSLTSLSVAFFAVAPTAPCLTSQVWHKEIPSPRSASLAGLREGCAAQIGWAWLTCSPLDLGRGSLRENPGATTRGRQRCWEARKQKLLPVSLRLYKLLLLKWPLSGPLVDSFFFFIQGVRAALWCSVRLLPRSVSPQLTEKLKVTSVHTIKIVCMSEDTECSAEGGLSQNRLHQCSVSLRLRGGPYGLWVTAKTSRWLQPSSFSSDTAPLEKLSGLSWKWFVGPPLCCHK